MSGLFIVIGLGLFLLLCHAQIRPTALAICAFLPRLFETLEDFLRRAIEAVRAKLRSVGAPSPLRILIGIVFLAGAALCAKGEYPILLETFKLLFPSESLAGSLALIGVILPALVAFLLYSPADGPPPMRAAWVVAVLLVVTVGALAFWRQLKVDEAERHKEYLLRAQVESAGGTVQIEGQPGGASVADPVPAGALEPWWLNPVMASSLAVLFSVGNQLCFHAAFKQAGSGMVLVVALPLWLTLGASWVLTALLNRSGLLSLPGAIVQALLDCVQRLVGWFCGLPAVLRRWRRRRVQQAHLDELWSANAEGERRNHAALLEAAARLTQMSAERVVQEREKLLGNCEDGKLLEAEQLVQSQIRVLRSEGLADACAIRAELERQRRLVDSQTNFEKGEQP